MRVAQDMNEAIDLICCHCIHLRTSSGGCDAFPGDIPDEIVGGWNKHRKPLPGQGNKIVFEEGTPWEEKAPGVGILPGPQ